MSDVQRSVTSSRSLVRSCLGVFAAAATLATTGCFGPDYNAIANKLRKANMEQEKQIADLNEKLTSREATWETARRRRSSRWR